MEPYVKVVDQQLRHLFDEFLIDKLNHRRDIRWLDPRVTDPCCDISYQGLMEIWQFFPLFFQGHFSESIPNARFDDLFAGGTQIAITQSFGKLADHLFLQLRQFVRGGERLIKIHDRQWFRGRLKPRRQFFGIWLLKFFQSRFGHRLAGGLGNRFGLA